MCLYPKLIRNRKYLKNKKNDGVIPAAPDPRVKWVPVGCGNCMECRKQKSREWLIRLLEEIKTHRNGKFITLTFNEKQLKNLREEVPEQLQGYDIENWVATKAVRRFLERWRKEYGKSLRHWLVTELGQTNTERIHLHGIIWTNEPLEQVEKHWQYGWIWKGKRDGASHKLINYVNGRTANYITKYVSKTDKKHPSYKSRILTSKGIGSGYMKTITSDENAYKEDGTNELYRTTTGHKISLPIYYRNKIYTEEDKERLWLQRLDKEERWVNGERVSIENGDEMYWRLVEYHRKRNTRLGYGTNHMGYDQKKYEENRRNMMIRETTFGGIEPPKETRPVTPG